MEMIDHAVLIDVKSLPNLLSKEHKLDVHLDEEQRTLLYGDEERRAKVKIICQAASAALDVDVQMEDATSKEAGVPHPLPWRLPAMYDGWGTKNVVSVRSAWARVRLPEGEAKRVESERREKPSMGSMVSSPNNNLNGGDGNGKQQPERVLSSPSVASISSGMDIEPGSSSSKPQEGSSAPAAAALRMEDDTTNHVWFNETRAEQDPALALLSEATQSFLKSSIEKAIGKARLRQNLDGVRLWHTLHARSVETNGSADADKPPPALIRLGCDVRRQIALSEGNAAKTYQRMEEAISRRQNDTYHSNNNNSAAQDDDNHNPDKMLLDATSMADLSKKPPLKSASQVADMDAKRKYAVFGGMDSQEPPFGRVPKNKAKVMLQDIVEGSELLGNHRTTSMIGARRKRFRVGLRY